MPSGPAALAQQRPEFMMLAQQQTVPFQEGYAHFRISPRTGYKWQKRFERPAPNELWQRRTSRRRPWRSQARCTP